MIFYPRDFDAAQRAKKTRTQVIKRLIEKTI